MMSNNGSPPEIVDQPEEQEKPPYIHVPRAHKTTSVALSQRYKDASPRIRAMVDITEAQVFDIAATDYKGRLAATNLLRLNVYASEEHDLGTEQIEMLEARSEGRKRHDRVCMFNTASLNQTGDQLMTLLDACGQRMTETAKESTLPPPLPEKPKGGLFGWMTKEKIIVERVPTNKSGSIVPDDSYGVP